MQLQIVPPVLEIINKFTHDDDIEFDEPTHVYSHRSLPDKRFTSVTTFVHHLFPVFNTDEVIKNIMRSRKWKPGHKYWGMTAEEIKNMWAANGTESAQYGTIMHNNIENFMNQTDMPPDYTHQMVLDKNTFTNSPTTEWKYFLQFVNDFPNMIPFRTEMRIFDTDWNIAGSVDMIYKNDDGTLSIYDWKRVKEIATENKFDTAIPPFLQHLPHCNFYHYSLQLNVYKAILEKNYGVKVTKLCLVVLHPIHDNYLLIECADLQREVLAFLEEQRLKTMA